MGSMTRDEAVAAARELGAHHADRATHRWIPRQKEDHTWEVVKVALPAGMEIKPLKPTIEAAEKPPQPDDPRTGHNQNIGRGQG
jgi:hypothetical protein